jgi:hypothetical protein
MFRTTNGPNDQSNPARTTNGIANFAFFKSGIEIFNAKLYLLQSKLLEKNSY